MASQDNSAQPDKTWLAKLRAEPNYRLTALIVACAMFMEHFDATVLATALPTIARDYHAPVADLSSAITAYLLALAIFIPVSGRLVDRFGPRSVFRAAVLIFVGSSILCAFSWSILSLTAARFLQGAGGAIMVPVGRLVILRVARKDQIVSAMAWLLVPMLIGPMLGPPIGGLIVTHLNWRWIFYVNVPIGLLGVALISLFIDTEKSDERRPLDWKGFFILGIALGALLFGFEGASRAGAALSSPALVGIGLIAGALYIGHARRVAHPVLDLTLLKDQSFRLSTIAGSLVRITQGGQAFLFPLLFQVGLGMNAAASGALILFLAGGALAAKAFTARILRGLGFRSTMLFNGLIISVLFALCGLIQADWPKPAVAGLLGVSGFFMSIQFTAYNTVAFEHIDQARMSSASSFYFTFQQMLLSLGVSIGALALRSSMLAARRVEPRPADFAVAFGVICVITATATFTHLQFPAYAGEGLNGRPVQGRKRFGRR